jgi:hypothetical protein
MFREIPATDLSLAQRKRVHGVGINDADYLVRRRITYTGKYVTCPFYRVWHRMLERCFSAKFQDRCPTYKGCTVCDEWLLFSNFKAWMESQDWQEKEIDKDIIKKGNKLYSPETCCFVSHEVNCLLGVGARRGKLPKGVRFCRRTNKYVAQIAVAGKRISIGYYITAEEAGAVYRVAKAERLRNMAMTQSYRVKTALLRHAKELSC